MKKPPPVISWFGPEVGEREKALLAKVIDSNYINDGSVTRHFEAQIARLVGTRYAVGVTSGTAAISLALMAVGVGRGDEVIVPDLTFAATANAVAMTGAEVRLVDIEPQRFAMDPENVRRATVPRTRAIVAVDVNGRGAAYDLLEPLARSHGLRLITDSAEGLGSRWRGRPLGSFGDAGCFSFSANKTVTCGQGGMVTTNDPAIHERLRELKDQGRRRQGTGGDDLHPALGFNFKLTNLQAAVGLAQLEKLHARLEFARQRDLWYRQALAGYPGIVLPPVDHGGGEVLQWTDGLVERRDELRRGLDGARIGYRAFWLPVHTHPPYSAPDSQFPTATRISTQGLWLPSAYSLTQDDIARTCDVIRAAMRNSG